jgi:hypothetical protein
MKAIPAMPQPSRPGVEGAPAQPGDHSKQRTGVFGMLLMMDLKAEAGSRGGIAGAPAAKRVYVSPVLTFHGTVANLTQAGSSGDTEDKKNGCINIFKPKACEKSDVRAKQDILRMGTHPTGVGLYLFRYRPPFTAQYGDGLYFGVMAQELLPVLPEAVSMDAQGYYAVDYALLDEAAGLQA